METNPNELVVISGNVATESHPSVTVTTGMTLPCVEGGETWLSE